MDPEASFLLVKRTYITLLGNERKQDAPMFAEQPGWYFHGKTEELFLFFLGKSGTGRRGG